MLGQHKSNKKQHHMHKTHCIQSFNSNLARGKKLRFKQNYSQIEKCSKSNTRSYDKLSSEIDEKINDMKVRHENKR